MAVDIERLDNRRFQDIVDEAKRRINAYSPEWTNHNLSDPGIALVELFAWMTEMTLFQLNKVPEREMKVLLDAVGFELFPAQAATADLTFYVAPGNTSAEVVVPTGTKVAAPLDGQQLFETESELRIAQPRFVECRTQKADGTLTDSPGPRRRDDGVWEMRFDGGLTCFDGLDEARASWSDELGRLDPPQRAGWRPLDRFTGDVVYFGFEAPLTRALIRAHFSVSTVRGLGIDPATPPLIWEASTSAWTGWRRCELRGIDSSAGLNRHGTMDVQIGDAHEPMALRGTERELYWVRVRIDLERHDIEHVYMTSPVLQSVAFTTIGGTIPAANAVRHERQEVGVSTGLPGQRIQLESAILGGGHTVDVWVGDASDEPWTVRDDFADATESSRVVVVDESAGEIAFGPLLHQASGVPRQCGAIPAAGATIYASYCVGGGPDGNVPAGRITSLQTAITAVDRVTNAEPASGGVARETLEEALERAPTSVRAGERAVTAADFERIVRNAARDLHSVACRPPTMPGGPVRLLVVPRVSTPPSSQRIDDYALSPSLCRRISDHLEPRRLMGTHVDLTTPFYLGVSVMMRVRRTSHSSSHHLRDRLLRLLYTHINPIVGGEHGAGLGYGETLTAEWIEDRLRHVDGVDSVEVVLFEVDLRQGRRMATPTRRIELPPDTLFMSYRHAVVFEGESTP